MADRIINGVMHSASKVYNGTCSKCGKQSSAYWQITKSNQWGRLATYCYSCTGNHWAKAFKLYREQLDSIEGKPCN